MYLFFDIYKFAICLEFFNPFKLSKVIVPLNGKGLMGVKENEKTLVRREYNKRADLRKAEDCN